MIESISSNNQLAEILTKPLREPRISLFVPFHVWYIKLCCACVCAYMNSAAEYYLAHSSM